MSVINSNQGHVKTSEVGVISAQPLLSTLSREDLETMISQTVKAISSNSQKHSLVLTSDAPVTWTGSQIQMSSGNILLKLLQTESVGAVTITIPAALLPVSMTAGQVWYLHVSRTKLQSSFTASAGDLVVAAEGSMPALSISQTDGTVSELTSITLANTQTVGASVYLYWQPNAIVWEPNKSAILGTVTSSTAMPVGAIIPFHLMGSAIPQGNQSLASTAPGWQLCQGNVIIDSNSSYKNPNRDSNGFPANGSYSSAADKFAPDLNGAAQTWSSSVAYVRGDRVRNTGNTLDYYALTSSTNDSSLNAVQPTWSSATTYTTGAYVTYTKTNINSSGQSFVAVFKSLASGNLNNAPDPTTTTAFWQPIWTSDVGNGSPFCKSAHNTSSPNTYMRGATTSPSSSSAYGGENTHVLTTTEMPNHNHTDSGHSHQSKFPGAQTIRLPTTGGIFDQVAEDLLSSAYYTPTNGGFANISYVGGGGAHNNEPRYFNAPQIIRIY